MPRTRHPVDIEVGRNIAVRRKTLGLTQTDVGRALGLSYQQIQKIESGRNRISAGRLWDASRCLQCPITYFYSTLDEPFGTFLHEMTELYDRASPSRRAVLPTITRLIIETDRK